MDVDYHTIFIISTATYYLLYWLMTSQSRSQVVWQAVTLLAAHDARSQQPARSSVRTYVVVVGSYD